MRCSISIKKTWRRKRIRLCKAAKRCPFRRQQRQTRSVVCVPAGIGFDRDILGHGDFGGHLGLFLDFHPDIAIDEVPDPYYGGDEGFAHVLDLVEEASRGLMRAMLDAR